MWNGATSTRYQMPSFTKERGRTAESAAAGESRAGEQIRFEECLGIPWTLIRSVNCEIWTAHHRLDKEGTTVIAFQASAYQCLTSIVEETTSLRLMNSNTHLVSQTDRSYIIINITFVLHTNLRAHSRRDRDYIRFIILSWPCRYFFLLQNHTSESFSPPEKARRCMLMIHLLSSRFGLQASRR